MLDNMKFLARRTGDDFFYGMTKQILSTIDQSSISYHSYYCYVFPHTQIRRLWLESDRLNQIVFHHDTLLGGILENVYDIVSRHKDKKIVIFSSHLTERDTNGLDNLYIVHWGSDFLLHQDGYNRISAVSNKNIGTAPHWISLGRSSRAHRILTAALIKALDLDVHGIMRIGTQEIDVDVDFFSRERRCIKDFKNWQDLCDWTLDPGAVISHGDLLDQGFQRLCDESYSAPQYQEIYDQAPNDNPRNFENNLRTLYQQSCVEIVNETTFVHPGYHVTEKFLNSVFGCNLPLVLASAGTVGYLRTIGFDMFDDVIDHGYDLVKDPLTRLIRLVHDNRRLLEDTQWAWHQWSLVQDRMERNVQWAKHGLHDHVRNQTLSQIIGVLEFFADYR